MSWVSWNNICTPKRLGVALLNLEDHMVARRFNLLKGMCIGTQPWAEIISYFVENENYSFVMRYTHNSN